MDTQGARSIQPKFQPVRPGKVVHLKRWTRFFETFPVGPNRSIEFWTEISGNFSWMDRALQVQARTTQHFKILSNSVTCFSLSSVVAAVKEAAARVPYCRNKKKNLEKWNIVGSDLSELMRNVSCHQGESVRQWQKQENIQHFVTETCD